MEENNSPAPLAPLQPQPAPVSHPHKEFFIIGSLFTVLMLLAASGILYFENYSAPIAQQTEVQFFGYTKDSSNIYYDGKIVEEADPATFEVSPTTNSFDAWDKNHRYIMGKIVATTTAQSNASVSNYRQLTNAQNQANSAFDVATSLMPFSDKKLSFSAGAGVTVEELKKYEVNLESKGAYGVLFAQAMDNKDELLYIGTVGTSSVKQAIYALDFAVAPYRDEQEFKDNCLLESSALQGGTYYTFSDPTPEQEAALVKKHGNSGSTPFYCGPGRYFVFGNTIVANYGVNGDATDIRVDDSSIKILN